MNTYEAALFDRAPVIGEVNPRGEIYYDGYARVPVTERNGSNLNEIVFPPSEQDDLVFVSHVVVLNNERRVVGVKALKPNSEGVAS